MERNAPMCGNCPGNAVPYNHEFHHGFVLSNPCSELLYACESCKRIFDSDDSYCYDPSEEDRIGSDL